MRHTILIGVFSLLFILGPRAYAKQELKSDILAVWDSSTYQGFINKDYTQSRIHRNLEVIFNYYGFRLHYVDVANGIPSRYQDQKQLQKFAGIVSWFHSDKLKQPKKYLDWLYQNVKAGRKLLVMGEFGAPFAQIDSTKFNQLLKELGIKYNLSYFDNPALLSPVPDFSPFLVEFERKISKELLSLYGFRNTSAKNETWLSVKVVGDRRPYDAIIIGERGGLVQSGYDYFENPKNYRSSWRINPFIMIEKIFSPKLRPIPDTNLLFGKRIQYSHIDGDGFISISDIDRKSMNGEIVRKLILDKYKLPTTVSYIVSELNQKVLRSELDPIPLAKKITSRNYVELATHTYNHPLSWNQKPNLEEIRLYLGFEKEKTHKGPILAYKTHKDLNYHREIKQSLDFMNDKLASKDKESRVVLWSGSCLPPEQAMAVVDKYQLLNMNGGDSRFDKTWPSYTGLFPLYRQVGPYLQVYSSNTNENVYTNDWKGPYRGFSEVINTFINTGAPELIKPANVYYHFYSGEKFSALRALDEVYQWISTQPFNYIFASDYIKIIQSFPKFKLIEKGDNDFEVLDHGQIKTIRFKTKALFPDYKVSKNVIGHSYVNNQLYVFLGEGNSSRIKLTNKVLSKMPYISSSQGWITSLSPDAKGWLIKGKARTKGKVEITIPNIKKAIINNKTFISSQSKFKVFTKGDINLRIRFK